MAEQIDSTPFAKAVLPSSGSTLTVYVKVGADSDDNRDSPPVAADEGDQNENRTDEEGNEAEEGDDGAYDPALDDEDDEADEDVLIIDSWSDDDAEASGGTDDESGGEKKKKEAEPATLFNQSYSTADLADGVHVVATKLKARKKQGVSGRKPKPKPTAKKTPHSRFIHQQFAAAQKVNPYADLNEVRLRSEKKWTVMSKEERAAYEEGDEMAEKAEVEEAAAAACAKMGGDGSSGNGDDVGMEEMEEVCAVCSESTVVSTKSNPVLVCDGPLCNSEVHLHCSGCDEVPDDDYFCPSCDEQEKKKRRDARAAQRRRRDVQDSNGKDGDCKENAAPNEGVVSTTTAASAAHSRLGAYGSSGNGSVGKKKKSSRSSASTNASGGGRKREPSEITPLGRSSGRKKNKKSSSTDQQVLLEHVKAILQVNVDKAMNFAPAPSSSAGRRRRRRALTPKEKDFAWTQYTQYSGEHLVNHRSLLHAHFECRGIRTAGSGSYDTMAETLYLYDRGEIGFE